MHNTDKEIIKKFFSDLINYGERKSPILKWDNIFEYIDSKFLKFIKEGYLKVLKEDLDKRIEDLDKEMEKIKKEQSKYIVKEKKSKSKK